jgi:hypothetical protein
VPEAEQFEPDRPVVAQPLTLRAHVEHQIMADLAGEIAEMYLSPPVTGYRAKQLDVDVARRAVEALGPLSSHVAGHSMACPVITSLVAAPASDEANNTGHEEHQRPGGEECTDRGPEPGLAADVVRQVPGVLVAEQPDADNDAGGTARNEEQVFGLGTKQLQRLQSRSRRMSRSEPLHALSNY